MRLGLLKRDSEGKIGYANETIDTLTEVADEGLRRFHRQSLENAKLSLENLPEKRDMYAATFPMPMGKLNQAKQLLKKLNADFCSLLEE